MIARSLVAPLFVLAFLGQTGCRPPQNTSLVVLAREVVLVRKGSTYGAFILTNGVPGGPDLTDYTWFMRADGKTTFDPKDPAVSYGTVKRASHVIFGPFDIEWSSGGGASGYVYFPPANYYWYRWRGGVGVLPKPGGISIAVTDERDPSKIDAADPKWKFRKPQLKWNLPVAPVKAKK